MSKTKSTGVRRGTPAPMDDEPADGLGFSIRVASRMTAIAPDTLRVWERRYGFPKPARRPGGSRIYSRGDVERLRLVARGLGEGYRPHEIVGKPMSELQALLDAATSAPPVEEGTPSLASAIDALTSDDPRRLARELRRAALLLSPRAFVTEYAQPLAKRIGDLWQEGVIEIRQEHVLTEALLARLHILLAAYEEGTRPPIVLLATLPGELHTLGLAMVALYIATAGATPRVIGASTPVSEIVEAAHAERAHVVGLTATMASDRAATRKGVTRILEGIPPKTQLWVGGELASDLGLSRPNLRVIQDWGALDRALASAGVGRG